MFKRGKNASGGGGAEPLCDKDKYVVGSTVNSFTNGQSVQFPSSSLVMFNCIDYTSVHENTAVGMSIIGVGKGKVAIIGSQSSTTNKNVTDYDYLIYNRGGNPTTSLNITFS